MYVHNIIYTQVSSLVWGLLTLTPISLSGFSLLGKLFLLIWSHSIHRSWPAIWNNKILSLICSHKWV